MKNIADQLTSVISSNINDVESQLVQQLLKIIHTTKSNIFITGAGRSKLVGKFFAMRLMHLGKTAHIVGGLCTPSIQPGDILIVISSSGETVSTITICEQAKKFGGYLVLLTSNLNGHLAKLSNLVIPINAKNHKQIDYAPMGTVFEITTLVFLEAFIGKYMLDYDFTEEQLKKRHANLE